MEGVVEAWIVECKTHGKLGEVVEAYLGLAVFTAHVQNQTEKGQCCESCKIYPKISSNNKFKYPKTLE